MSDIEKIYQEFGKESSRYEKLGEGTAAPGGYVPLRNVTMETSTLRTADSGRIIYLGEVKKDVTIVTCHGQDLEVSTADVFNRKYKLIFVGVSGDTTVKLPAGLFIDQKQTADAYSFVVKQGESRQLDLVVSKIDGEAIISAEIVTVAVEWTSNANRITFNDVYFQMDYDKLPTKDPNTLYFTRDTRRIYKGTQLYSSSGGVFYTFKDVEGGWTVSGSDGSMFEHIDGSSLAVDVNDKILFNQNPERLNVAKPGFVVSSDKWTTVFDGTVDALGLVNPKVMIDTTGSKESMDCLLSMDGEDVVVFEKVYSGIYSANLNDFDLGRFKNFKVLAKFNVPIGTPEAEIPLNNAVFSWGTYGGISSKLDVTYDARDRSIKMVGNKEAVVAEFSMPVIHGLSLKGDGSEDADLSLYQIPIEGDDRATIDDALAGLSPGEPVFAQFNLQNKIINGTVTKLTALPKTSYEIIGSATYGEGQNKRALCFIGTMPQDFDYVLWSEAAGGQKELIIPKSGLKSDWVVAIEDAMLKSGEFFFARSTDDELSGIGKVVGPSVPNGSQYKISLFAWTTKGEMLSAYSDYASQKVEFKLSGVSVHNSLYDRDAEDSHPIEAITDLAEKLDEKVNKSMAKATGGEVIGAIGFADGEENEVLLEQTILNVDCEHVEETANKIVATHGVGIGINDDGDVEISGRELEVAVKNKTHKTFAAGSGDYVLGDVKVLPSHKPQSKITIATTKVFAGATEADEVQSRSDSFEVDAIKGDLSFSGFKKNGFAITIPTKVAKSFAAATDDKVVGEIEAKLVDDQHLRITKTLVDTAVENGDNAETEGVFDVKLSDGYYFDATGDGVALRNSRQINEAFLADETVVQDISIVNYEKDGDQRAAVSVSSRNLFSGDVGEEWFDIHGEVELTIGDGEIELSVPGKIDKDAIRAREDGERRVLTSIEQDFVDGAFRLSINSSDVDSTEGGTADSPGTGDATEYVTMATKGDLPTTFADGVFKIDGSGKVNNDFAGDQKEVVTDVSFEVDEDENSLKYKIGSAVVDKPKGMPELSAFLGEIKMVDGLVIEQTSDGEFSLGAAPILEAKQDNLTGDELVAIRHAVKHLVEMAHEGNYVLKPGEGFTVNDGGVYANLLTFVLAGSDHVKLGDENFPTIIGGKQGTQGNNVYLGDFGEANQVLPRFRVDQLIAGAVAKALKYKGSAIESVVKSWTGENYTDHPKFPEENKWIGTPIQNGDFWYVTDFDVTKPGTMNTGHAIYNEAMGEWEIDIDNARLPDNITLDSDSEGRTQIKIKGIREDHFDDELQEKINGKFFMLKKAADISYGFVVGDMTIKPKTDTSLDIRTTHLDVERDGERNQAFDLGLSITEPGKFDWLEAKDKSAKVEINLDGLITRKEVPANGNGQKVLVAAIDIQAQGSDPDKLQIKNWSLDVETKKVHAFARKIEASGGVHFLPIIEDEEFAGIKIDGSAKVDKSFAQKTDGYLLGEVFFTESSGGDVASENSVFMKSVAMSVNGKEPIVECFPVGATNGIELEFGDDGLFFSGENFVQRKDIDADEVVTDVVLNVEDEALVIGVEMSDLEGGLRNVPTTIKATEGVVFEQDDYEITLNFKSITDRIDETNDELENLTTYVGEIDAHVMALESDVQDNVWTTINANVDRLDAITTDLGENWNRTNGIGEDITKNVWPTLNATIERIDDIAADLGDNWGRTDGIGEDLTKHVWPTINATIQRIDEWDEMLFKDTDSHRAKIKKLIEDVANNAKSIHVDLWPTVNSNIARLDELTTDLSNNWTRTNAIGDDLVNNWTRTEGIAADITENVWPTVNATIARIDEWDEMLFKAANCHRIRIANLETLVGELKAAGTGTDSTLWTTLNETIDRVDAITTDLANNWARTDGIGDDVANNVWGTLNATIARVDAVTTDLTNNWTRTEGIATDITDHLWPTVNATIARIDEWDDMLFKDPESFRARIAELEAKASKYDDLIAILIDKDIIAEEDFE